MDANEQQQQTAPNVPFFRMRRKPVNTAAIRKRNEEEEEKGRGGKTTEGLEGQSDSEGQAAGESGSDSLSGSEGEISVNKTRMKLVEKRQQLRGRNLMHTTSKKRRREMDALAEESTSSSSEEGDAERTSFDPEVKFASSGAQRMGPTDMGATARNQYSNDTQSQFERVQEMLKKERVEREKREAEQEEDRKKYGEKGKKREEPSTSQPKLYRGMAVYGAKEREDTIKGNATSGLNRLGPIRAQQYMRASVRWDYAPDICKDYKETGFCTFGGNATSGLNRLGPIRAQQYMRASVRWDYAPDICKDYKETGFCTFGDSCKFMHDRSDYKHGWEIERDWEAGKLKETKADEFLISSDEGEDEEVDKLPHSCYICREQFRKPVATKCKHYFCEECALAQYQRSKKCAVCGEKTEGVFNVAREILAKMKARNEAKAKKGDDELEDEAVEEPEVKTLPMDEGAGQTVEEEESNGSED
uniref:EOG090X04Q5 n=1 Tax=Globodera pallida TaxID=36090 RepID=A0A183CFI7_GLOPA